jgi:Nickel responsive protein SCO4226-like
MQLYAIRRRSGWEGPELLEKAAAVSAAIGDEPDSGVRWIRSYVLAEDEGDLGTLCIYEGDSPEAIRVHAGRVGMPANEITPVVDTVVVRPDPAPVAT